MWELKITFWIWKLAFLRNHLTWELTFEEFLEKSKREVFLVELLLFCLEMLSSSQGANLILSDYFTELSSKTLCKWCGGWKWFVQITWWIQTNKEQVFANVLLFTGFMDDSHFFHWRFSCLKYSWQEQHWQNLQFATWKGGQHPGPCLWDMNVRMSSCEDRELCWTDPSPLPLVESQTWHIIYRESS